MLNLLFSEPGLFIAWFCAFLIALTVHEFSHAAMGTYLGDETARRAGRLTLNPAAHIDPWGLGFMLLAGFGWGKPVPFNPYQLKWPKWGPVFVAFAGPASNLVMAIVGLLGLEWVMNSGLGSGSVFHWFLVLFIQLNVALLAFNLIPLPPLDGSKLLLTALSHPKYAAARLWIESRGPLVLLGVVLLDSILNIGLFSGLFAWIGAGVLRVADAIGLISG